MAADGQSRRETDANNHPEVRPGSEGAEGTFLRLPHTQTSLWGQGPPTVCPQSTPVHPGTQAC